MIFVCLGTQIFQFDRLLKQLDELVKNEIIKDEIFAQIGASTYEPINYKYKRYLDNNEFDDYQNKAELIISHGGTGALIRASKKGKNIIAIPRLAKYREHVDDHQLQIVNVLEKEGYIRAVYDINNLEMCICKAKENPINKIYSRESRIIEIIEEFIRNF